MELMGAHSRGGVEREEAAAKQQHELSLQAAANTAALQRREEEHTARLRQMQEQAQAELALKRAQDEATAAHLKGLKELGVDLTQYLVACAEKQPDKVLKVVGATAATGAHGGLHIHATP